MSITLAELKEKIENLKSGTDSLTPICSEITGPLAYQIENALTDFEQASEQAHKIAALNKIQKAISDAENQENPRTLAKAILFQKFKNQLFCFVKDEFARLNLRLEGPNKPHSQLSSIITNMLPEKANQLTEILAQGMKADFNAQMKHLYDDSDTSEDAKQYREFLFTHHIKFLGGKNSTNFQVTNLSHQNRPSQILKIDAKAGPGCMDQHLQAEIKHVFLPHYATRQTIANINHIVQSRTIIVTDFCQGGSLEKHAQKQHLQNQVHAFADAVNISIQMCNIYLDIQKAGCFFRDSKLSNWLIDETGNLRIADTKSFVFIDENGIYKDHAPKNRGFKKVTTSAFDLPEFKLPFFDAEKAHAALLGKNLYTYLSSEGDGCPPENKEKVILEEHFEDHIFATPIGQQFKNIILKLNHPDPDQRISLNQALITLNKLGSVLSTYETFETAIKNLRAVGVVQDTTIEAYINQKIGLYLDTESTDEQRDQIIAEMDQLTQDLSGGLNHDILKIISKLHKNSNSFFSTGNGKKAYKIAAALEAIPLDQRKSLASLLKTPDASELAKALNFHRNFWKSSSTQTASFKKIGESISAGNMLSPSQN